MATDGDRRFGAGLRFQPPAADLTLAVVLTALTAVTAVSPALRGTLLGPTLGVPFLLFVPGYALTAMLFPRASAAGQSAGQRTADDGSVDAVERVVFSFALSLGTLIVVGLGLVLSPLAFGAVELVAALGLIVLVGVGGAVLRRRRLPPAERFRLQFRRPASTVWSTFRHPESRVDAVLNVVVVLAVVLAVGSVATAGSVPGGVGPGEADTGDHTKLSLLTGNESSGYEADNYPTALRPGETQELVVGVGNDEGGEESYTTVVELHGANDAPTGPTVPEIVDEDRADRFVVPVEDGETTYQRVAFEPTVDGDWIRVTVLLYRGDVPERPTLDTAYRSTNLWLPVKSGA